MTVVSHSSVALAAVTQLLQGVRTYKYGIRLSYTNGMTFIPSIDRIVQWVQNLKWTRECVHACTHMHMQTRTHKHTHTQR